MLFRIVYVTGNGTSDSFNFYSFYDKHPKTGINYYRLKQIDYDGRYEYSKMESLRFVGTDSEVSIFPNPINIEKINIQVLNNETEVSIIDRSGQLKYQRTFEEGVYELSLKEFSSGVYFVRFVNGGNVQIRRLIVTEP